jgi:hypothetical protein
LDTATPEGHLIVATAQRKKLTEARGAVLLDADTDAIKRSRDTLNFEVEKC